jgi:hypothetical protein
MNFLDRVIFGSGHGLAMPVCDEAIYWLNDEATGTGCFYQWSGWFGAQLASHQWRHPRVGDERVLMGRRFRPCSSSRRWFRVRVSWSMKLPDDLSEANKSIHELMDGLPR